MKFESEKTAQHLREQFLAQDASQRMTTIHALSSAYLGDSRAVVSGLLLAALGGSLPANAAEDNHASVEEDVSELQASEATLAVGQVITTGRVVESMQASANDETYEQIQTSRVASEGAPV